MGEDQIISPNSMKLNLKLSNNIDDEDGEEDEDDINEDRPL